MVLLDSDRIAVFKQRGDRTRQGTGERAERDYDPSGQNGLPPGRSPRQLRSGITQTLDIYKAHLFQLKANKHPNRKIRVIVRFLLIPFQMTCFSSLSLASSLSDRFSRESGIFDDGLCHQLAITQREHKPLAPPTFDVGTLRKVWHNSEGAHSATHVHCASWPTTMSSSEHATGDLGLRFSSSPAAKAEEVSLSGWFTVIWNDRTRYFLTDDQGRWTELVLDEEMAKPFGGPLAFNRKRVKIVGKRGDGPPGAIRVLSIAFE